MPTSLEQFRARFRENPADPRAFEALEEHLFLRGDWPDLLVLYSDRIAAPDLADHPDRRARLLLRRGQVLDERCDDPDSALDCYREAARLDPSFRPALEKLRTAYARRSAWELVLQVGEVEVQLPMSAVDRADLHAELGRVWSEELGDSAEARSHFERALELDPANDTALQGLASALENQAGDAPADALWEAVVARRQGSDRARALCIWAGSMESAGRTEDALGRLADALALDPENRAALDSSLDLAAALGRWDQVALRLGERFAVSRDSSLRVADAVEAGRLYLERLEDPESAHAWFSRALELAPRSSAVWRGFVDLARARGDAEALGRALELATDAADADARPDIDLLREAAAACSARGDHDGARDRLSRALDAEPESPEVLAALDATYALLDRHSDRAEIIERRAALCMDVSERAGLLLALGDLAAGPLSDPDAASDAFERAYACNPLAPLARERLATLHRKHENWDALRHWLVRTAEHEPAPGRAGLLCELAELNLDRFDRPDEAREAVEAALAEDPNVPGGFALLGRIARRSGDTPLLLQISEREALSSADPARVAVLAAELAEACEEAGDRERALSWIERWLRAEPESLPGLRTWARLLEATPDAADLDAVLAKLENVETGDDRISTRLRRVAHRTRQGRCEEALQLLHAAREEVPGDRRILSALVEGLVAADRHEEAIELEREQIEGLPPEERANAQLQLAEKARHAGDVELAIDLMVRAADREEVRDRAEPSLLALLESEGLWTKLCDRLRVLRLREAGDTPTALALDLRRAAVLSDRLDRHGEAASVLRAARSLHPTDPSLVDALESELRAIGDHAELARLLEDRVAAAEPGVERDRWSFERAQLLAGALGSPGEARSAFEHLARTAADDAIALQAASQLEALLEAQQDWRAMASLWETRLARAPDNGLHLRVARLYRDHLHDRTRAIDHFEAAAHADAAGAPWQELAALYAGDSRIDDLLRATEAELATHPAESRARLLRARAASLWARPDGDSERAAVHYEALLALEPVQPDAVEFLASRHVRSGNPQAATELLEGRLSALLEEDRTSAEVFDLRLRLCALCESLGEIARAIDFIEPMAGSGPLAGATRLAALYRSVGRLDDLVSLCERTAGRSDDPRERAQWRLRQGDTASEIGDRDTAEKAYRAVLADRPGDPAAQLALCTLYRLRGESDSLIRLLETRLEGELGPEELPIRLELAELLAADDERAGDAISHLRRVLTLDAQHTAAATRILELADRTNRRDAALEALEVLLRETEGRSARARLYARRGDLLATSESLAEDALESYREALDLDAGVPSARRGLHQLLDKLGRNEDLLALLNDEFQSAAASERSQVIRSATSAAERSEDPFAEALWLEREAREQPTSPSPWARLAALHRNGGRFRELLHCLAQQASRTDDPTARSVLHAERGKILARDARRQGEASAAYRDAYADDPKPEYLDTLLLLYEKTGQHRERSWGLCQRLEGANPDSAVGLHAALGALYLGQLAEPERAVEHYWRALEGSEGQPQLELLQGLGSALYACGRIVDWSHTAERELEVLDPESPVFDERRRILHRRLARTYASQWSNPREALRHWRVLVDGDEGVPEDEDALLDLLRQTGCEVELAERLERRVRQRSEDGAAWLELARLRHAHLHDLAAAADAYERVLALDPESATARRGLLAISEELEDWETAARALEAELAAVPDGNANERAALALRLGDICWKKLGSTTRGQRAYALAHEADPRDCAALQCLAQLSLAMEDWRKAAEWRTREVAIHGDENPEQRHALWVQIARLRIGRLSDGEGALAAFDKALELGPLAARDSVAAAALRRARGDTRGFTEALRELAESADSPLSADDQLELARAYEELDQSDAARTCVERALELDAEHAAAWDMAARLRDAAGDSDAALEACLRSAALHTGDARAQRLMQAALRVEGPSPERAAEWLAEASDASPRNADIHLALARIAEKTGQPARAATAAEVALECAGSDEGLAGVRMLAALIAARVARAAGETERALHFYETAIRENADGLEALEGIAEMAFARDETARAREACERFLAIASQRPEGPRMLAIAASTCAAESDSSEALRYADLALVEDENLELAHRARVQALESLGDSTALVEALDRLANCLGNDRARAEQSARAAALLEDPEQAARRYREALECDPLHAGAWLGLTGLLAANDRMQEAAQAALEGLGHLRETDARVALARLRSRALEALGDASEAARAHAEVANTATALHPEAALEQARLLRSAGEWRGAAETLERFAKRNAGEEGEGLAIVLVQWGRLLAGPLEEIDRAIEVYRQALEADPDSREAEASLAELLSYRPSRWEEALASQRALLAEDPTRVASLRAVLRVARGRRKRAAVRNGLAILSAVGFASPRERARAPDRIALRVAQQPQLQDTAWEKARRIAQTCAVEIAEALGASANTATPQNLHPCAAYRAAALAAEGELAAPALVPLSNAEIADALCLVAELAEESDQVSRDGRLVNALSAALGRRTRRRVKRILEPLTAAQVAAIDFDAWRVGLREVASAVALDATGGDLSTALLAQLAEDPNQETREVGTEDDLGARIRANSAARNLLERAVLAWVDSLG